MGSDLTVTTSWFSVSPSAAVRSLAGVWLGRWWWAVLAPVAVCLVMSFHDIRFAVLAFLIALVLYPAAMALVYFNHALRPVVAASVFPHKITISPDGIFVEFRPRESAVSVDENDGAGADPAPFAPEAIRLGMDSVAGWEDTGRNLVIRLKSDSRDLLIVPIKAFASAADAGDAVALLATAIPH